MYEGPIDCIEALGWLTCGKEVEDPNAILRRPKFSHPAVRHLYKIEISSLFAKLQLNDEGAYSRDDPLLFEDDLNELLRTYGPEVWPEIGQGDRSHLRTPDPTSRYRSDIVYPRDSSTIKEYLRKLILVKKARQGVDLRSLAEKKGEKRTIRPPMRNVPSKRGVGRPRGKLVSKIYASTRPTPPSAKVTTTTSTRGSRRGLRSDASSEFNNPSVSDHEDSPSVGIRTRASASKLRSVAQERSQQPTPRESVLRLYSCNSRGDVTEHGEIVWNGTGTADELFAQISHKLEMDVSWLLFDFPGDMFPEDIPWEQVPTFRIDRGSRDTNSVFELSVKMLREAPDFGLPRRSVQVECGLDMDFTNGTFR